MANHNLRGREAREFWIALEGAVTTFTGYATPGSKTMWYVPGHGVTLTMGVHLFDTREEAHEQAHRYLDRMENIIRTKRRELPPRGDNAIITVPQPQVDRDIVTVSQNSAVQGRISDEALRMASAQAADVASILSEMMPRSRPKDSPTD